MEAERERRIQTICLLILSTIATAVALYWLRGILIPFVLAIFLAFALVPLVDLQVRYLRLPRGVAVFGALMGVFIVLNLVAGLVSTSVRQMAGNVDAYERQIQQLIASASAALPLERLGVDLPSESDLLSLIPSARVGQTVMATTSAVVGVLSQGLVVLVFLFFLLMGRQRVAEQRGAIWAEVESRIRRYIVTQAAVSAATGLLVGLVLAILGIDLALVFGLLAFLLNFIPTVGSIIATLLPIPVVLVTPEVSLAVATLAIGIPALIQFTIGNVIAPKVMGDSLDLHPVVILLALMFWGSLWGMVGMLLATPMTAVMRILLERAEMTAPLAQLMAGRMDALHAR